MNEDEQEEEEDVNEDEQEEEEDVNEDEEEEEVAVQEKPKPRANVKSVTAPSAPVAVVGRKRKRKRKAAVKTTAAKRGPLIKGKGLSGRTSLKVQP